MAKEINVENAVVVDEKSKPKRLFAGVNEEGDGGNGADSGMLQPKSAPSLPPGELLQPSKDSSAPLQSWEAGDAVPATTEGPSEGKSDLDPTIENLTPEEANQILRDLLDYEGRLPLTFKRRAEEEQTVYCRLPMGRESKESEILYIRSMHQYRRGTEANEFMDKIPTAGEFIMDLFESLPQYQKDEIDRIQADTTINANQKNLRIMMVFQGSPHFMYVQNTADILAQSEQNSMLVSRTVEKIVEKNGKRHFVPVWNQPRDFDNEPVDVCVDVINKMFDIHRKLQNSRFLASSSEGPVNGGSTENYQKNSPDSDTPSQNPSVN